MKLQTDPNLVMLEHNKEIPKDALCYGKRMDGSIGWAKSGAIAGTDWNRYSLKSPSIILIKDKQPRPALGQPGQKRR